MAWYENYYRCNHEDSLEEGEPETEWTDQWSAMCNDRCPVCNHEIEPYDSDELSSTPNCEYCGDEVNNDTAIVVVLSNCEFNFCCTMCRDDYIHTYRGALI